MKKNNLFLLLLALLCIWIFRSWFQTVLVSSGDLKLFYTSNFKDYFLFPYAWGWNLQNGLGDFFSAFAWLDYNYSIPIFIGNFLHLNWQVIERVFYLFPFLILNFVSSAFLFRKIFSRNPFFLLAPFIYLFNTYIFMMVGGGQIVGISLAYAIFPLVLYYFIKIIDNEEKKIRFQSSLLTGLLFAILTFFDLRFAYILLVVTSLYFLLNIKRKWKNIPIIFMLPLGITGLIHAFWILPVVVFHQNPAQNLGSAFSSLQSVQYFSFAKLENSIGLLHPNWPENIFGKVSFMKPEFLVLPILAFASLLFLPKKDKREQHYILYFALLGLVGVFLAKGANDPFGGVYLWMFNHVPGFVMFRDPTKWYMLIVISYSILIPFTVWNIYELINSKVNTPKSKLTLKIQKLLPNLFVFLFALFWLFTIRQAVLGQLGGIFKAATVPAEYISFEQTVSNQPQFFRTLWVPILQNFGFSSQNHPAVSAEYLFNVYDEKNLIKNLDKAGTEKLLQEMGVKYVIVPIDPQGEIFLSDNKYSEKLYKKTRDDVSKIPWLKRITDFGKLAVFEVPDPKDHFWSSDLNMIVQYSFINPTKYFVSVHNAKRGDLLVFSESFDNHWIARFAGNNQEASVPYDKRYNSFVLPQGGSYTFNVYYSAQKWVDVGVWVSLGTLVVVIGSLIALRFKIKD